MPRPKNLTLEPGKSWKFAARRYDPEDEVPSSSFLSLKLRPVLLYRWPAATRATIAHPEKQTENENDVEIDLQDGKEDQISKNDVANSDTAANRAPAAESLADESAQQPVDQAPITPGPAPNRTFQAAVVGEAAPPSTPTEPQVGPVSDDATASQPKKTPRNARNKAEGKPKRAPAAAKRKDRLPTPAHHQQREAKSTLKKTRSAGVAKTPAKSKRKQVTVDPEARVHHLDDTPLSHNSNEENESPVAVSYNESVVDLDGDSDMSDASSSAKEKRPGLKLSFSRKSSVQAGGIQPAPVQTPAPQSATTKLKLKFGGASTPAPTPGSTPISKKKKKQTGDTIQVTPGSNKKRKHEVIQDEADDGGSRPAPAPPSDKPPILRKLTFKNAQAAAAPAPKATGASQLLFKVKGKAPKRSAGVGYDSELEESYPGKEGEILVGSEKDPVIHEGFVLRMQPGEDADYLRKSIEDGKAGEILTKGGAAINLRMLDTLGRRGILHIKDHKYATSLVDLPCIIEGMKSWDKKGWIKSIDICQMLLVLGRCKDEEEARSYPLPEDVDSKTFQYAHGITAPMKWVRKRRFARTKRARVDDIEAVERRVHALLEADKAAMTSKYQLLDHDPRLDEHGYSTDMEEDEDEDAEGEVDNYFDYYPGAHSVSTPVVTETPVEEELDDDDVEAIERMFFAQAKNLATEPSTEVTATLHPPEAGGDSSFAVTSTSATPSATAAATPVSAEHEGSSEEEEDDEGEDEDRDDAEKEGDESKRQALERIDDMTNKISEQRELLKKTTNQILKKKLARRIQDLEDDVAMMRKNAGLARAEDDE